MTGSKHWLGVIAFSAVVFGCKAGDNSERFEKGVNSHGSQINIMATSSSNGMSLILEDTLYHPVPRFTGRFYLQTGGPNFVLATDSSGGVGGKHSVMEQIVWDSVSRKAIFATEAFKLNEAAVLSSDGKYLAGGYQNLTVLTVPGGLEYRKWYRDDENRMARPCFHPDGRRILVSSGPNIDVWSIDSVVENKQFPLGTLQGHSGDRLSCFALSSDGQLVVSGDRKGDPIIWNLNEFKIVRRLPRTPIRQYYPEARIPKHGVSDAPSIQQALLPTAPGVAIASVAFFPDATKVAIADYDYGAVSIYDIRSGKRLAHTEDNDKNKRAIGLAVSSDARHIVLGYDVPVIWDWQAGSIVGELGEHRNYHPRYIVDIASSTSRGTCNALAFSEDGQTLVTGGFDGTLRFWRWKM